MLEEPTVDEWPIGLLCKTPGQLNSEQRLHDHRVFAMNFLHSFNANLHIPGFVEFLSEMLRISPFMSQLLVACWVVEAPDVAIAINELCSLLTLPCNDYLVQKLHKLDPLGRDGLPLKQRHAGCAGGWGMRVFSPCGLPLYYNLTFFSEEHEDYCFLVVLPPSPTITEDRGYDPSEVLRDVEVRILFQTLRERSIGIYRSRGWGHNWAGKILNTPKEDWLIAKELWYSWRIVRCWMPEDPLLTRIKEEVECHLPMLGYGSDERTHGYSRGRITF